MDRGFPLCICVELLVGPCNGGENKLSILWICVELLALPIYLDKIFHPVVAVILSVTFVLDFGEIIPQAVCSRHGLAVGENCVWLVRVLMKICFPIAYPIGKILDSVLGCHDVLFRRPQLKALLSMHGQETAEEAMTPIESTFSLDVS